MEQITKEMREEFQIPPYFPDGALMNYAREGTARLEELNPGVDLTKDITGKGLLKNYMYYAYHHRVNEWEDNYASNILSWQMGTSVKND